MFPGPTLFSTETRSRTPRGEFARKLSNLLTTCDHSHGRNEKKKKKTAAKRQSAFFEAAAKKQNARKKTIPSEAV